MLKKISLAISTVALTSFALFNPLEAQAVENSNSSAQEQDTKIQQNPFKNAQGKYDFNKGPNTDAMPIEILDENSKQKLYDLNELKQNNQISQYEYNDRASKVFNQYLGLDDTNSELTDSSNKENDMNSKQQEVLPETGEVEYNNAALGLSLSVIGFILVVASIIRKKRIG